MRDGWVEATLRDALEPIANRPDGKDYPLVLSVTEKRGIIPQTEIFKHRIATDDISKYKVLEPMDIAYNPYLLWCGAIGQWQGSEAGVVSPVYECFRVKSNCEPRYLGYIFETGILTSYFDALAIGSIVRRRRTIPSDFIAAPIQLPPLPDQKRIVDLISSVDSYIEALQQQLESAKRSRNAVLHELLTVGDEDWVERKLPEVVEVLDRMRKPINSTEREERKGIIPYYGANGQTGWIDEFIFNEELVLLGEDAIDFADPSARKAYLIQGPSWVNNHAHVLRADKTSVNSYFLMESLNKVDYSQYVSFGTRSKLTQASMNGIKILLPSMKIQEQIVDLLMNFDEVIETTHKSIGDSKVLRSGMLSNLLSGQHEIPDSYDKVIGAA